MGCRERQAEMKKINIYTDGAARGNPGNGGYGAVLEYTAPDGRQYRKELSGGYRMTTNNRMELMGVIAALEVLEMPCEVDLYSDSQYLVHAFTQHWIDGWKKKGWMRTKTEPVKNVDLWKRLTEDMTGHVIHWHWVKGHAGHPQNERCDALATAAADHGPLKEDTGYSL